MGRDQRDDVCTKTDFNANFVDIFTASSRNIFFINIKSQSSIFDLMHYFLGNNEVNKLGNNE